MNAFTQRSLLLSLCVLICQYGGGFALTGHRQPSSTGQTKIHLPDAKDTEAFMKSKGMTTIIVPRSTGARCLDGTPYTFDITYGNSKVWTIHMSAGGDGCNSESDCMKRTNSYYGSSLIKDPNHPGCTCKNFHEKGLPYEDCTCVNLLYCDGAYFAGGRYDPVRASDGTLLWSRGRRNLEASLEILLQDHGLASATELMLTGHSSGGLSTMFNLDFVRDRMPSNVKVLGMPIAGFTLDVGTCCDASKCCYKDCCFSDSLQGVYDFHNLSYSLSADCVAEHASEPSKCLLGVHAAKHVKTPMFLLQSKHDAFQLHSIQGMNFGDIYNKQGGIKELLQPVREYGFEFVEQFNKTMWSAPQHSAFVTSCICHAACGLDDSFFWNHFNGEWLGVLIGRWSAGTATESIYMDNAEPNYDCDSNGQVQAID